MAEENLQIYLTFRVSYFKGILWMYIEILQKKVTLQPI